FSSRRRHTRSKRDWSSDVCSSDLRPTLRGDIQWCQGFSEPNAGSDIAALRTKAVREGDDYIANGHKMWTSFGQYSDWCLLLARRSEERRVGKECRSRWSRRAEREE